MNVIDTRTAIILISAMSALMSLVLFALKRSYPANIRGLGVWSQALLIIVVGGILAAARGKLPEVLTTLVPNFLLCWGVYRLYAGTQQFHDVRPYTLGWLCATGGVALLTAWFTFVEPDYASRLRLVTGFMAVTFGMHARFLLQHKLDTFSRWLTTGVLAYIAVIQVLRLATSYVWPPGDNILNVAWHHALFIASFSISILLFSVGAVLMAGDRLCTALEHLATCDSLTKAFTRRHMDEACSIELEHANRTGSPSSILLMDLDHFKAINDTHGHQAGDRVLVQFVAHVRAELRKQDLLGRFGGEEFALFLPNTRLESALQVAERIRLASVPTEGGIGCTVSIGVTTHRGLEDSLDMMLSRADAALYQAKNAGRNRVLAG